jgi:hypothetical protein
LLEGVAIHLVFHFSLLKKKVGNNAVTISAIRMTGEDGKIKVSLAAIFDKFFDEKG